MSEEPWQLPISWVWALVRELGEVVSGGTPSTKERAFWGADIVWFSPADLTGYSAKFIRRGAKSLSALGLRNSAARVLPAGSVMFSSRAPIGYVAINEVAAATNQGFKSVVPGPALFNEYLYYYLKASKQLAEGRATGTTFKEISGSAFSVLPVPVAPIREQHRIVAKIDELFSELDKAAESLKLARERLQIYRQALLKAAFEGKLTGDRADEKHSWRETRLGDEITFLTSGSRGWGDYYSDSGDVFIRAQNLKHDKLDLEDIAYVRLPSGGTEGLRTRVQRGDILITITGANVTKTGIVNEDIGTAYVSQHVALCRPGPSVFPQYLYWYLLSEAGGRRQLNSAAYGAGKPGLNLDNIREVTLALPSIDEQRAIVGRLDALLSAQEHIRHSVEDEIGRVAAVRQSVLKQAFSGHLVPQNPADEPAADLLPRLRGRASPSRTRRRKAA